MSSFKDLNELENRFERAEELAAELDRVQISYDELFSAAFMQKYTSVSSLKEFLEAGGFHAESSGDLLSIPDDELDRYIAAATQFTSWKEMGNEAAACYFAEKLGL